VTLQHADTRLKSYTTGVPRCVTFPPRVEEFVAARGYHLALLKRGDQIGMSHTKKGFYPLLVSELPDDPNRDDFLADIAGHGFRAMPDGTIIYGDCMFFVRSLERAEHFDREAREAWEALNNPEQVYAEVDQWTQHFRNSGLGNSRVEARDVRPVEDHVDNSAERDLVKQLEERLKAGE
jgi:hypothetical protein